VVFGALTAPALVMLWLFEFFVSDPSVNQFVYRGAEGHKLFIPPFSPRRCAREVALRTTDNLIVQNFVSFMDSSKVALAGLRAE
jgi:hypothetical protein